MSIYKKQYAINHGYEYLQTPYTEETNHNYKRIIDEKVNENSRKLAEINSKIEEHERKLRGYTSKEQIEKKIQELPVRPGASAV